MITGRSSGRRVLLTSTCWWSFTARIALRFAELDWRVEAICPTGHTLRTTSAVTCVHDYAPLWPVTSLAAAIRASAPDLIVPCDDRAVAHLHDLHAQWTHADPRAAQTITRSLGRAESFTTAARRSDLIRIAREEGLRAPEMQAVTDAGALRAAIADFGLPIVLKADGTWGGSGVSIAHTQADAQAALAALGRRLGPKVAVKRLLVERDPFDLLPGLLHAPQVNAQRFVRGRPATCTVACQDGRLLAGIQVEVVRTDQDLGPSNVVRVIDHTEISTTVETLVRQLGLSGFCGFDFLLEDGAGHAHLIEMNPRSTAMCHLALGPGRDPVAALAAEVSGSPAADIAPVTHNSVIAFFPQAWKCAPNSPYLWTAYHDVPWGDPDLIREMVQPPYSERGVLARLLTRLRQVRRRRRTAPAVSLGQSRSA